MTTKSGKEYRSVQIEIPDGQYSKRVNVNVYGQAQDSLIAVRSGDVIVASGSAAASCSQSKKDQKWYGNLVVNAMKVEVIGGGIAPQSSSAPAPASNVAAPDNSDDVPF